MAFVDSFCVFVCSGFSSCVENVTRMTPLPSASHWFPWCGLLINTQTLEVANDYTRLCSQGFLSFFVVLFVVLFTVCHAVYCVVYHLLWCLFCLLCCLLFAVLFVLLVVLFVMFTLLFQCYMFTCVVCSIVYCFVC